MKKELTQKENLLGWIKSIVVAVIIALVLNNFILVNASVPTGSMENTINVGDRLFANRLAFLFLKPERGDIIVFDGTDNPEKLFVKRVIGLPGESISIKNGVILVDEIPMFDDYTNIVIKGDFGPYVVPEDHYFMLGDNRNDSHDSRFWTNTYVPFDTIKGKVFIKYFPEIVFMNKED